MEYNKDDVMLMVLGEIMSLKQSIQNLENHIGQSDLVPNPSNEGGSTMYKERVKIGMDANGRPLHKWVSAKTREELLMRAIQILMEHGALPEVAKEEPVQQEKTLFAPYANDWLSLYKANKLRHTTVTGYRSSLNNHILPHFGKRNIEDISISDIQKFMDGKARYARKTIEEIMLVLKMIFDSAIDDKIITSNPAKSKRLVNPSDKKNVRMPLTESEVADVIAHVGDLTHLRDRRYVALLLYLPVRRGEIFGFQMQDIDTQAMEIRVRQNVTHKGNVAVVGKPKTDAGCRTIPIIPQLWDLLELTQDELADKDRYLVSTNEKPYVPYTNTIARRAWQRISSQMDVHEKTPHCFRHTFATFGHRAGIDEKTMQTIGGWKDLETLRKVYTHTQERDLEIARKQMEGLYKQEISDGFVTGL